jgi:hypothetical protein
MTPAGPPAENPITFIEFLHRRGDISVERFHYHWRAIHGPMGAAMVNVDAYLQIHRVEPALPGLPSLGYIGIVQAWFSNRDALERNASDPIIAEVGPDGDRFLDRDRSGHIFAEEELLTLDPNRTGPGIRAVLMLTRERGVDLDQFRYDVRDLTHSIAQASGADRASLNLRRQDMTEPNAPAFDAVACLSWPDLLVMERGWASSEIEALLAQLPPTIEASTSAGLLGEEHWAKSAAHPRRLTGPASDSSI